MMARRRLKILEVRHNRKFRIRKSDNRHSGGYAGGRDGAHAAIGSNRLPRQDPALAEYSSRDQRVAIHSAHSGTDLMIR
jgi:hypothetical protein